MRPVLDIYPVSQGFGEGATAGVVGNWQGNALEYLVAAYGNYQPDGHAGTDIACPVGTPVRAARGGRVVWADWDVNLPGNDSWGPGGYFDRWGFYRSFGGRIVVIEHSPGDLDVYAHLSAFKVRLGQVVSENELVGNSGDSSGGNDGILGPHLHTERIVDLSYSTGNGLIFGRTDPQSVWGSNTTTTEEDDDLPNSPMELQEAALKVITQNKTVIGDRTLVQGVNQTLMGLDVVNSNIAQLKAFIAKQIAPEANVKDEATTYYLKGKDKPEVYALDIATGKLRHIESAEFNIVQAIGLYREVDQVKVDALLKANQS